MRILIVAKNSINKWAHDMLSAGIASGYETQLFSVSRTISEKVRGLCGASKAKGSHLENRRLTATLNEFKPELIIYMTGQAISLPAETAKCISENCDAQVVSWACDCFDRDLPEGHVRFDHFFYFDTFLEDILTSRLGYRGDQVHFLPLAVNPDKYFPIDGVVKQAKLVFCGGISSDRAHALDEMRANGVPLSIFGPRHGQWWSSRISRKRMNLIYNQHLVALNLQQARNTKNGLNLRSFEVPATSSLLLTSDCEDLRQSFIPNEEVLVFSNLEELKSLLERACSQPEWAAEIASAGRRRVLSEHTYRHRLDAIVSTVRTKKE